MVIAPLGTNLRGGVLINLSHTVTKSDATWTSETKIICPCNDHMMGEFPKPIPFEIIANASLVGELETERVQDDYGFGLLCALTMRRHKSRSQNSTDG